jgi:prepilin-type N-terminal cleavage/methylation domain-containing protein
MMLFMRSVHYRPKGFSLIEMSIALILIALISGLTITAGQVQVKVARYKATQDTLVSARQAMEVFYTKYKRYPCPALPATATTSATYGFEVAGGCDAACPAGLTCPATTNAVIGTFPYKTLGLGDEFGVDDWNNKFTYIVDKLHTTANTSAIYGAIPILDKNGNEITQSPADGDAIFILISHGPNGNGAWPKAGGTQATCDATLKDSENCDNDIGLIDVSLRDGSATTTEYFDDIVVWKTRDSTDHINTDPPSTSTPSAASSSVANSLFVELDATCVVFSDGSMKCSGQDTNGKLANGPLISNTSSFTTEANGFTNWVSVSGALSDTSTGYGGCGLLATKRAYCWGKNEFGQTGNGTTSAAVETATEVAGSTTDWVAISRNYEHACGIREPGRAYCWGNNVDGNLGNGTLVGSLSPIEVLGVGGGTSYTDWVMIRAAWQFSCGLRSNGRAYCWGDNGWGQLGDGTNLDSRTPVEVGGGFTDWVSISGYGSGMCGVRSTGQAYCWGRNDYGQLGKGIGGDSSVPTEVSGSEIDWTSITYGWRASCGIRKPGIAYCWGANDYGALGSGIASPTIVLAPQLVSGGIIDWLAVSPGFYHSCGVRANGGLYCWGQNASGQYGDGTTTSITSGPTLISGATVKTN